MEDLCVERDYLIAYLQSQDARSRRLLGSLAAVEQEQMLPVHSAAEARRMRREVGLLKNRISEASQQEGTTLMRLSDLYAEIRRRERLFQIYLEQQHLQQQQAAAASMMSEPGPAGPYIPPPMVLSAAGWLQNGEWMPLALPLSPMSPTSSPGALFDYEGGGPWSLSYGPGVGPDVGMSLTHNDSSRVAPNEQADEIPKLKYAYVGDDDKTEETSKGEPAH